MKNETNSQNAKSSDTQADGNVDARVTRKMSEDEYSMEIEVSNDGGAQSDSAEEQNSSVSEGSVFDKIIERSKATKQTSEDEAAKVEHSEFEKSLFVGGQVDWVSYIDREKLFEAFNYEAVNTVDVRFSSYQKGLLHLLQHCYSYFYALKTDSERYSRDIKDIDNAISSMNLSSNKKNALEVKIIKLVWKGTNIDRRRISTYANLLKNAWCKGEVKAGVTDEKGSILPSQFSKQIEVHGGINQFSRQSAAFLRKQAELQKSGYTNSKDRNIDLVRDAIRSGVFRYNDYELTLKEVATLVPSTDFFNNCSDGEVIVTLCTWDRSSSELKLRYCFGQDNKDGVVDKAESQYFEELKKSAIEKKGY